MSKALKLAQLAFSDGEIPVGAVIVRQGEIIAEGRNDREGTKSCFGHAEMNAINMAQKALGDWRLDGCTIYVTLEPCAMCAGAIINSRIDRVVYAAEDKGSGCFGSAINLAHCLLGSSPKISKGVLQEECERLLDSFFKELRKTND